MHQITVRYYAAAAAAAGVKAEVVELGEYATIADLLALIRERHDGRLARVLDSSSLLLNEVVVRDPRARTTNGATVDVLPPFAGG